MAEIRGGAWTGSPGVIHTPCPQPNTTVLKTSSKEPSNCVKMSSTSSLALPLRKFSYKSTWVPSCFCSRSLPLYFPPMRNMWAQPLNLAAPDFLFPWPCGGHVLCGSILLWIWLHTSSLVAVQLWESHFRSLQVSVSPFIESVHNNKFLLLGLLWRLIEIVCMLHSWAFDECSFSLSYFPNLLTL